MAHEASGRSSRRRATPSVEVSVRQRTRKIDREAVRALAEHVLRAERRPDATLSVTIVSDRKIAELHRDYLGVPGPTDVISFPLEDDLGEGPGGLAILGEVVVSADTAAREAKARRLPFERELLLYVAHGTLHLLGYDDHAPRDRARMHRRQEALLERFLRGRAQAARRV